MNTSTQSERLRQRKTNNVDLSTAPDMGPAAETRKYADHTKPFSVNRLMIQYLGVGQVFLCIHSMHALVRVNHFACGFRSSLYMPLKPFSGRNLLF